MTSATERLRALLTERGVEYRVSATGCSIDIGPNVTAYANRTDTTLDVSLRGFTPEQAVDATLGPGTCEDVGRYAFVCSECGWASDEPHHVLGGFWPKYCPNCGARVVEP